MTDRKTTAEQMEEVREAWAVFVKEMVTWQTLRYMVAALVFAEAFVLTLWLLGVTV